MDASKLLILAAILCFVLGIAGIPLVWWKMMLIGLALLSAGMLV